MILFTDRREAGKELADRLAGYARRPGLLVLGLPQGGIAVAFEVARRLDALLEVFVVPENAGRQRGYRGERPFTLIRRRTVIVVDDGIATGATMSAALAALKPKNPARLVVAVPVAPPQVLARLRGQADEVLSLYAPEPFSSIGSWYEHFEPTSDEEVRHLLRLSEGDRQLDGTFQPRAA